MPGVITNYASRCSRPASTETLMESKPGGNLHMLFFPLMTKGHILPMVEIAKLFAARGVVVTLLTTPANATLISLQDSSIRLHLIPIAENGVTVSDDFATLLDSVATLRLPFDEILRDLSPDCVVSDFFMPWTYDVAFAHGVPRLVFDGFSFFTRCLEDAYLKQNPMHDLAPDAQTFVLHSLPDRFEFLRSQFPDPDEFAKNTTLCRIWNEALEVNRKSYGAVVNSFYELEPDYAEYFRNVMGGKAWGVGPVSLSNDKNTNEESHDLFKWLDSQKEGSVVYMCFGTMSDFSAAQLMEMAIGLERSGHPFVWAVRSAGEDWIPQGFEGRIQERGLVIRGWAPQSLILNHASVGGFVTHCGWNSCLEGIVAGLAMATWPLFAEQFYNEKQLIDLLGIGVAVGAIEYGMVTEQRKVVAAGMLEAAVRRLMAEDEEADERRRRARALSVKARRALEKGGSSYNDISAFGIREHSKTCLNFGFVCLGVQFQVFHK
ncbi:hypothetical protein KSP39_PZI020202 [Platanthera zijinensis]|uniref:Glycosyltransferase n=1 Tax=Platanthera zijinensis TaxID=2320716 RepID=A0AAP0FX72_9ASPA